MLLSFSRLMRRRMNGVVGQFRSSVWDPFLLVTQIFAMQFLFYTSLGVWVLLFDMFAPTSSFRSLDQIFRYQSLNLKDTMGRLLVLIFLFNSLTVAFGLFLIVKRAKLCLDFSLTIHLYHLLVCWFYNGTFAWSASWWLLQVVCSVVSTVLGEYLCMREEMRAIPVGLGPKSEV